MEDEKGELMDYWWELILKDETRYEIPPDAVATVQRRMGNKDPINLSTASIPFSEIKHFRITDKPYGQQPLLEAAAQAFNEPMYNQDSSIIVKWVKRSVPRRLYDKHYAHIPSYRRLGDDGTSVIIAFRQLVHMINVNTTTELSEIELTELR